MVLLRHFSSLKRTSKIPREGKRTLDFKKLRKEKAERDKNEDGLILCEDWKIGIPKCGIARPPANMDLHHIKGRDGKLLLDESNLLWLTREHHEAAHHR